MLPRSGARTIRLALEVTVPAATIMSFLLSITCHEDMAMPIAKPA